MKRNSENAISDKFCRDCLLSTEKLWHGFTAKCQGCCARAAARSPHFARVRRAGMLDRQYRSMLEQFDLTHDQVKAASETDFLATKKG